MYDFLIAGSGLFGAVFAYEAKQRGKPVPYTRSIPYKCYGMEMMR